MLDDPGLSVVDPGLVPSPPVALHHLHLGAGAGGVKAVVIRHDLPGLSQGEHLVPSQSVAGRQSQPSAGLEAHRVQALPLLGDGPQVVVVDGQLGLGVDGLQVPAEGLALEPLPQLLTVGDVPPVHLAGQRVEAEVEVLPVVHPDLR